MDVFLIEFNMISTVAAGLLSLYLGHLIKNNVKFLERFGIPAAVMGGLIFALIHLLLRTSDVAHIKYDNTLQSPFMLLFFTTIGLSSSIEGLKKGGKLLIIFWLMSGFMTLMQTVIGVSFSKMLGLDPLFGVLTGSASMSGGHGAAGAFGQTIEDMGVTGSLTVALSAATFGLIAGGFLGSPLAISLIRKYNLKPTESFEKEDVMLKESGKEQEITVDSVLLHALLFSVLMGLGMLFSSSMKEYFDISLPSYVGAMCLAIVFNNINIKFDIMKIDRHLVHILGEVGLCIFLSMALISLRLWELYALAIPIVTILCAQVLFMFLYTRFIVFKALGGDYDAAVMVAGMCGSGLGATTNAMINMEEVSSRYGYTVNPYLVIPLTGAFLIDMFQMPIIITAINMFAH